MLKFIHLFKNYYLGVCYWNYSFCDSVNPN